MQSSEESVSCSKAAVINSCSLSWQQNNWSLLYERMKISCYSGVRYADPFLLAVPMVNRFIILFINVGSLLSWRMCLSQG